MSILKYNGVSLPYADTTQFRQKVIRDPSDTDWYLAEYEIVAQMIVCVDYLAVLAPDLIGGKSGDLVSAAGIMKVLQTRMMQHRKTLSFTFNGVELIPQAQTGNKGTVDADNGPKPQSFTFVQLSNATFLVQFHIIARYWQNTAPITVAPDHTPIITNDPGNVVLYNRWSEEVEIDDCDYTTRTREGKFIIRSDNIRGFTPDDMRTDMAVLQLPPGFLRKSSWYKQSEDGLGLQYKIVDQEVYKRPPFPAFTAKGKYRESATMGGGLRFGEASVVLRADKSLLNSQFALEKAAVRVAIQKIKKGSAGQNPGLFNAYFEAGIEVDMYDNSVAVRISCMLKAKKNRLQEIGGFGGVSTFTPGSDDQPGYIPPYSSDGRGSAGFFLQAAAYYDPNLQNVRLNKKNQMDEGLQPGQAGKTKE